VDIGSFLSFLGKAVVNGQNSDIWEFGKGALSAQIQSLAVLQSERGKRIEGGGGRQNVKVQSPNAEISGRVEKRALSANQDFFAKSWEPTSA